MKTFPILSVIAASSMAQELSRVFFNIEVRQLAVSERPRLGSDIRVVFWVGCLGTWREI